MDRRNFLRSMLGVAVATALPSEVWPFKKIFLPPAPSRIDILDMSLWGKKPLDIAAIEALELEHFSKAIPDLVYRATPLFDLIKKQQTVTLVNGNVIRYPMTMPAIPDPTTTWLGLSRSKYPGRLSVPLRSQNLLHAPATPENVMEFIDDLEDLSKRES